MAENGLSNLINGYQIHKSHDQLQTFAVRVGKFFDVIKNGKRMGRYSKAETALAKLERI